MSLAAKRGRRTASLVPNYVILIALALFALGPVLVLVFNSLKTNIQMGANPLGPPLDGLRFMNYPEAWERGKYALTMRNSLIVVSGTIVGVCIIAGLAAYALARLDLPGADLYVLYLLVGTSIPFQLFLVPLFFMWQRLGLLDSHLGLMLIYWATYSPFFTFLLRSYIVAIPTDFEDAARVDGANTLQVMRHVLLPMIWPGFLTVALLAGLWSWNEFFFATTFIHNDAQKTVITSYAAFVGRFTRDWGLTNAGAVITSLPIMLFFLVLQRRFVEGLTQGGLRA